MFKKDYEGKVPSEAWVLGGVVGTVEGVEWDIHSKKGTQGWVMLHLRSKGKAANKANYSRLQWNGSRFAIDEVVENLKQYRPGLYGMAVAFARQRYPEGCPEITSSPTRTTEGVIPEGWEVLKTFYDDEGAAWDLARAPKDDPRNGNWHKYKVAAQGSARGGANFWLAWNGTRLASNIGVMTMLDDKNEVLAGVMSYLTESCSEKTPGEDDAEDEGYAPNPPGLGLDSDLKKKDFDNTGEHVEVGSVEGYNGHTWRVLIYGAQGDRIRLVGVERGGGLTWCLWDSTAVFDFERTTLNLDRVTKGENFATRLLRNDPSKYKEIVTLLQANDLSERIEHDLKEFC